MVTKKRKKVEPLPCPFCGEMPSVEFLMGWASRGLVLCDSTDCHSQPSAVGKTRAEAIRRWNTRGGRDAE